jgi:hypothetical protein
MTHRPIVTVLCLLLLSPGCYVKTSLDADKQHLPANFSAPILVVTVQDTVGLQKGLLAELEQDAVDALSERGIKSIILFDAIGDSEDAAAIDELRNKDYRALLKIVINQWGSKTEILPDSVPTSVTESDAGPDSGSSFRAPTAIDYGQTVPGPESSYKEVVMVGSLTDLLTSRLVWSGRLDSRPGVVGRSIFYHKFNRDIRYEDLARRCFKKLAKELDRLLPEDSES